MITTKEEVEEKTIYFVEPVWSGDQWLYIVELESNYSLHVYTRILPLLCYNQADKEVM